MTIASDKMSELNRRLIERRELAAKIGAVYKFVLEGEGGGTFIVNRKDDVGVREGDGPAPCTLRLAVADGIALFEGKANGQALFMSQKLKVEGDIGLALKLSSLTDIIK
jgi:predicted lipid carrier protein YhbT